jgi:hypothetical protein
MINTSNIGISSFFDLNYILNWRSRRASPVNFPSDLRLRIYRDHFTRLIAERQCGHAGTKRGHFVVASRQYLLSPATLRQIL